MATGKRIEFQKNGLNWPDPNPSNNGRNFSSPEFMKMNRLLNLNTNLLSMLAVGLLATAAQAETVRYNSQPGGSKATVAGDSSIHARTMESGVIGGFMEVDANFPESAPHQRHRRKTRGLRLCSGPFLKSGKTTMDERMRDTMSMTNYPKFEYRVLELKPKSKPDSTGPLQFDAVGT